MTTEKFVFSDEERAGVAEIRAALGNDLPADLDTDFNLRRWWIGWKGNLKDIEPRFRRYIENRRAAGFDREDFMDNFFENPHIKPWLKYFACSKLGSILDTRNNTWVFFQRMEGVDYKRIVKVMRMSDFLFMYFAYCEMMLRLTLKREAESGRPSGISVINDMHGANYSEFLNPQSPINKVGKLCTHILQENYCEILSKMVAFRGVRREDPVRSRAPAIFNAIWQFMKFFVNENTLKKIAFVSKKEELPEYFDPSVLPVAAGGQFRDQSGWGDPDTCTSVPRAIERQEKYVTGSVWDGLSVTPPLVEEFIRPNGVFQVARNVQKAGQRLGWQFMVNGEIEFAVFRKDRQRKPSLMRGSDFADLLIRREHSLLFTAADGSVKQVLAYPRFQLITARLAEEGSVVCAEPGEYIFEFINNSSYMFSIKLEYAVATL